jgi:uncharacterized protein (TIGR00251 family)
LTAIGDSFLTVIADGIEIAVRLTPKGGRDAVDGIERLADGRAVLKVRVRAAPVDGEANAALVGMMARALGVAPRNVELTAGATSRIKRLRISGDAAALTARVQEMSRMKAK